MDKKINYEIFQKNIGDMNDSEFVELCANVSAFTSVPVKLLYNDKDYVYDQYIRIKMMLIMTLDGKVEFDDIKKEDIEKTTFTVGFFTVPQNQDVIIRSTEYNTYAEIATVNAGEQYRIVNTYSKKNFPYTYYVLAKDVEKVSISHIKNAKANKKFSETENKTQNTMTYFVYRLSR